VRIRAAENERDAIAALRPLTLGRLEGESD